MAEGTLVFEFFSALDLENQMRAYLRLPQLKEVEFATTQASPLPVAEPTKAIMQEVGRIAREGAAALEQAENDRRLEHAAATQTQFIPVGTESLPTQYPAPEQVQPSAPVTGPVVETVTLETVETVPYEELLAFCERNPVTGMDVTKCKPSFFRKLVEMRVKAYLETK